MKRICMIAGVAVFVFVLLCPPSHAQVAVMPKVGTVIRAVQIKGQFENPPLSSVDVYTVPADRRLRITDLLFTNYDSSACDVSISGKTYEIRISANSTFVANLLSGPDFGPGEVVTLVNTWRLPGHGATCRPIYTIMGYLYTNTPTP
jgi:hypothetical protein